MSTPNIYRHYKRKWAHQCSCLNAKDQWGCVQLNKLHYLGMYRQLKERENYKLKNDVHLLFCYLPVWLCGQQVWVSLLTAQLARKAYHTSESHFLTVSMLNYSWGCDLLSEKSRLHWYHVPIAVLLCTSWQCSERYFCCVLHVCRILERRSGNIFFACRAVINKRQKVLILVTIFNHY